MGGVNVTSPIPCPTYPWNSVDMDCVDRPVTELVERGLEGLQRQPMAASERAQFTLFRVIVLLRVIIFVYEKVRGQFLGVIWGFLGFGYCSLVCPRFGL